MAVIAPRPLTVPRPRLSLTAAASQRKLAPGRSTLDIQQEGWQERMWHFYDNLGSVHYGVQFKKNAASKVSYFAAEINEEDPDQGPQQTTNPIVEAAVDRLHSGYGDINEIVAELMIHLNVPGEGYLVGREGLDGEEWDVWSVEEVKNSQFAAFLDMDPDRATAADGAFACRIWRPHPRNRHLADAPLRPVADQCEQLLLLEDSISAAAKSRLSAGLFYLPTELDIGDQTAFEDQMIAILTTPIREHDSAARWAPGLIRGPAEFYDRLGIIPFSREIDATFAGMREELTRAIAAGLDLPAEIILGKGDLNHWTGWDIDESAFRDHIDPDIILILDSITRGYLHPALQEAGVPDFERFLIWRDLSDLGQQPPTIAEALEMHAAGTVDDQYIRDLAGVADDYIPDEPPPAPEPVGLPIPTQGPPVQIDALVAATARGRPLTELSSIDRRLLDRITEASEAAFNRVLERAGAKIRSHARKDRAISLSIDQLPNDGVTRHLGEKLIAQLQITPGELVPPDSFDPLVKRLRTVMDGAAQEVESVLEGLTGARPVLNVQRIQGAIGHYTTQLEALSVRLLFNPLDPGPGEVGDSVVPQGMVMDFMTQAAGGVPTDGPSDVRGFATGQESLEFLEANGYQQTGHQWEYGDSSTRRRPFPPHRRLDGVEFVDWQDERLDTPASASFLNVGHMFPGDHYRCQCRTVPVVIPPPAASSTVPGRSPDGFNPEQVAVFNARLDLLEAKYGIKPTYAGTGNDATGRRLAVQSLRDRLERPNTPFNRHAAIRQDIDFVEGGGNPLDRPSLRGVGPAGEVMPFGENQYALYVRDNLNPVTVGDAVTDQTSLNGVITHEYGHVWHASSTDLAGRSPVPFISQDVLESQTFQGVIQTAERAIPTTTEYSTVNINERIAEAFRVNELGHGKIDAIATFERHTLQARTWDTPDITQGDPLTHRIAMSILETMKKEY